MLLIGQALYSLVMSNEHVTQLLKSYFRVRDQASEDAIEAYEFAELGPADILFRNTVLRIFCYCCCCFKRCRQDRIKHLYDTVDDLVEKALDIRTLFNTQILVTALIHQVFESKHHTLLKLQRNYKYLPEKDY